MITCCINNLNERDARYIHSGTAISRGETEQRKLAGGRELMQHNQFVSASHLIFFVSSKAVYSERLAKVLNNCQSRAASGEAM